jgi:predicted dehydrogenase
VIEGVGFLKKINIGVVGSAFSAGLHIRSYGKLNQSKFQVLGVASAKVENARLFAEKNALQKVYSDYEEMLRDPEIDVVDLCTPNNLHCDMIVAAAEAGKNIICEKPLTGAFGSGLGMELVGLAPKRILLKEAIENVDRCVAAVRRNGVVLGYAENYVYSPPLVKMKRLLSRSGGTIFDIRADESHSGSHAEYARTWSKAGGGSLIRLGSHPIGAVLHIKQWEGSMKFGKPIRPRSVVAEVGCNTKMASFMREEEKFIKHGWVDVEDWSCAIITFDDESRATVFASDCTLGGVRNRLEVYSSNAVINVNINPSDTLEVYAPREGIFGDEYIQEKLETNAGWNFPSPDEEWVRGYDGELMDFVDCFREGRTPVSDLALAEDTTRVIYSAYVSADEGRRVTL